MNFHKTDWDKFRVFYFVAASSSITKAAKALNTSQPSISRLISYLEERLKTRLFNRNPRGVALTDEGIKLFKIVQDIYGELYQFEAVLKQNQQNGQGNLKISLPYLMPSLNFSKCTAEFVKQYPDTKLHFTTDVQDKELTTGDVDGAIRFKCLEGSPLEEILIETCTLGFYVSHDYRKQYGFPEEKKLIKHKLIAYSENVISNCETFNWILKKEIQGEPERQPDLWLNSIQEAVWAGEAGVGIVTLPQSYAKMSSKLVQVMLDSYIPPLNLYYSFPVHHQKSEGVRSYGNFLLSHNKSGYSKEAEKIFPSSQKVKMQESIVPSNLLTKSTSTSEMRNFVSLVG